MIWIKDLLSAVNWYFNVDTVEFSFDREQHVYLQWSVNQFNSNNLKWHIFEKFHWSSLLSGSSKLKVHKIPTRGARYCILQQIYPGGVDSFKMYNNFPQNSKLWSKFNPYLLQTLHFWCKFLYILYINWPQTV